MQTETRLMLRVVKDEAVAPADALAAVRAEVGRWLNVSIEPGVMPGSLEFQHHGRVLGSVYPVLGGEPAADLIVPPATADALIAQRRARANQLVPAPGWITVPLGSDAEIASAISLFRDSYERAERPLRLV